MTRREIYFKANYIYAMQIVILFFHPSSQAFLSSPFILAKENNKYHIKVYWIHSKLYWTPFQIGVHVRVTHDTTERVWFCSTGRNLSAHMWFCPTPSPFSTQSLPTLKHLQPFPMPILVCFLVTFVSSLIQTIIPNSNQDTSKITRSKDIYTFLSDSYLLSLNSVYNLPQFHSLSPWWCRFCPRSLRYCMSILFTIFLSSLNNPSKI